ncbi:MAG: FKBP-type peptidyl-prolyl cis-trans isomerase [Bacteroidota bacterium]
MKFSKLAIFLAIVTLFAACESQPDYLEGFTTDSNDLQYKFLINVEGQLPEPGDQVNYHVYFMVGDSVFNSSRMLGNEYVKGRIPMGLEADFEGNQLLQSLTLMSPGDSLVFFKPADSINQAMMPALFQSGKPVFVHIALDQIKTLEVLQAEKQDLLSDMDSRDRGCYLKIVEDQTGDLALPEGGIAYELRLLRLGQELYSSYATGVRNSMTLPDDFEKARKQNPLLDAILELSIGDSANILIESDSIVEQLRPDWGFQSGDLTDFRVKMVEILTPEEVEAKKELQAALQRAQQEEQAKLAQAQQKEAAEIQEIVNQKREAYNAGSLTVERTASGLEYLILEKGSGPKPQKTQTVSVQYMGVLMDGTKFDSSFDQGRPIQFPLGVGRVIKGWDEGIALLSPGSKAMLFIPSEMAYGQSGAGKIPPNAQLCFYVELLASTN